MFGSKPAAVAPAAVQVLLLDYLIDGYFANPEIINAKDSDFWNMRDKMFSALFLKSVQFQATGNLSVPPRSVAKDFQVCGDTMVALIPRDDTSVAHMLKANPAWRYPLPVEIYVGAYVVRGSVLRKGQDLIVFDWNTYLVRDVEIESLLPGAQFRGLKAPHAFISGQHKHFIASTT